VGPRVIVPLVLLPYGAPVLETLEEKPVDPMMEVTLEVPVGTLVVLLTGPTALVEDEELLVVRGAVGPRVIVPLVLLPYGAPLLEAVEENPVDATLEVTLAILVERPLVLLLGTMALVEDGEVPVVKGTVGPRVTEPLVLLPYGAPLLETLEENPLEAAVVVLFVALEVGIVVLLALEEIEDETPVERDAVGPREIVLLVPLPYGAPLVELLEKKPVEAALEVALTTLVTGRVLLEDTLMLEEEVVVETGTVGPREIVLLVPLP
jgi:hypothetical protein